MADIDTGLGWYADQDWLSSTSGSIGSYSKGADIEPLPTFSKIHTIPVDNETRYATNESNSRNMYFLIASASGPVYASVLISGNSIHVILSSKQTFNVTGYEHNTQTFSVTASTPFLDTSLYGVTWVITGNYSSAYNAQERYDTSEGDTILDIVSDQQTVHNSMKVYLAEVDHTYDILFINSSWRSLSIRSASKPVYFSVAYYYDNNSWAFRLTASSEASFTATYAGSRMTITNPSPYGYAEYGFTYYFSGVSGSSYSFNRAIHVYDSRITGAADVHQAVTGGGVAVTVNYAKSSAGYSVVCMCKWIASYGGDVYLSPVLISSQPNNTLYTRNSTAPSVNNTEHSYQGMTFYMRKAPLDVLDGAETITSDYPIVDLSGVAQTNDTIFAAIAYQSGLTVGYIPADEDPYSGGGTSEPGGGGGSFDNTSDQIDDSITPVFSFAGSGFCRIYNPNLSQLQNLANYLWTDTNFLQTIVNHAKQLLEDPIEAVISLAMLPVAIPQGTSETVKVLFISTGVSMPPATTQYVEVDCGTYTLEEYYGSALDYNPYTQVDLFLPFIGQVSLNTDEVMGHTIGVKYRVDIVSGLCVAKVFVDNDCMYQFSGNCAIFMPLNSADFSSYLSAAMTAATALVSAGAGMAAGAAAAGAEAVAEPAIQTGGNLLTSGESLVTPQMALQYRVEESVRPMYTPSGGDSPSASLGEMERKFISNSAAAVMGSKISFEHASHLAGNSGILGVRRPYLIINRPDMCNPEKYGKYNGRPCMMHLYLGNLTGYTEIQEIQLTGFSATNPELAEISKMLKGGVIF